MPQHPPTSPTPYCCVKSSSASASSLGCSGYSAPCLPSTGSPAFGITLIGTVACWLRKRRCSLISAGPVAQFIPMTSMPSGSRAARAAPISDPSSIVPVSSTVTWAISATRLPVAAIARWAPTTAALTCSRSCAVSTSTASAPPSIIASHWSW